MNSHNATTICIIEQIRDVLSDSEIWNQISVQIFIEIKLCLMNLCSLVKSMSIIWKGQYIW